MFDWTVPDEWNIRTPYIAAPDGTRVVDFRLLRSTSSRTAAGADQVAARRPARAPAHAARPARPDPYRTSYYERTWGSASPTAAARPRAGEYEVSSTRPRAGHLTYAEHLVEGTGEEEVLISTSSATPRSPTTTSPGIVVAAMLAKHSWGGASSTPTASSSLPGRSGPRLVAPEPRQARSGQARPDAVVHRRLRESHVQAQQTR